MTTLQRMLEAAGAKPDDLIYRLIRLAYIDSTEAEASEYLQSYISKLQAAQHVLVEDERGEATYSDNMSQEEAKQAMQNGMKVTHEYFGAGEYVYMEESKTLTEEGYYDPKFWYLRDGVAWQTGWKIFTSH